MKTGFLALIESKVKNIRTFGTQVNCNAILQRPRRVFKSHVVYRKQILQTHKRKKTKQKQKQRIMYMSGYVTNSSKKHFLFSEWMEINETFQEGQEGSMLSLVSKSL